MENGKSYSCLNTTKFKKTFLKTEFDEIDLNFINVKGHLELQGFGSPQYVNLTLGCKEFSVHPLRIKCHAPYKTFYLE